MHCHRVSQLRPSCVAATILGVLAVVYVGMPVLAADGDADTASKVASHPTTAGGNLAVNGSFEDKAADSDLPASWRADKGTYRRDTTVSRSGKASLRYVTDPASYQLCQQDLPLVGGAGYEVSVWIKTKDVAGNDVGATVCLEWYDEKDVWLNGSYAPTGVKGTADWTEVKVITRVPKGPRRFTISCYVRKGMTGTAWFDNVEVRRVDDAPLRSFLTSPCYRGLILPEGPRQIRIRTLVSPPDGIPAGELEVRAELLDQQGKIVQKAAQGIGDKGIGELALPAEKLPVGLYTVKVTLVRREGNQVIATQEHPVRRAGDDFRPAVMVDEHGRVLVDGKPFFPLGMYWLERVTEAGLKTYSQSPFNCLLPYQAPNREQMDLCLKYNVKVIYSMKDMYAGMPKYGDPSIKTVRDEEPSVRARVREFRDHKALLAWYLNDELSLAFRTRLEAHQSWVAQDDLNHPTYVVLCQVNEMLDYLNTFDVIGADPYPVGNPWGDKPAVSQAGQWTRETVGTFGRGRGVWMVPQAFNWANYPNDIANGVNKNPRTPTLAEMRCMAWQCICEGANGLLFYSWGDIQRNPDVPFDQQWANVKAVAAEIRELSPVLLSIEGAPLVKVEGGPWLHWLVRKAGDKVYIFAVNDGDGEGQVTFKLPASARDVKVYGEQTALMLEGGSFRDSSKKLQVRVYEVELGEAK